VFIRLLNDTVSLPNLLLNIVDVSDIFNLAVVAAPVLLANKSILELKLAVSRANRLLNIAEVSEMFNLVLIRLLKETVSRSNRLLNIAEVSDMFNLALIRLLNDTVSLPIRFVNIAEVSDIFNLAVVAAPVLLANKSILELKLAVSRANRLLNIVAVSEYLTPEID
jgi:hypothetical protein